MYGIVLLSSWHNSKGHSEDLIHLYKTNGCIESIGYGAMIRPGESLKIEGALFVYKPSANSSRIMAKKITNYQLPGLL